MDCDWQHIETIPAAELDAIPLGSPVPHLGDGSLVREVDTATVFSLEAGRRRGVPNAQTFEHLGFKWSDVQDITSEDLLSIPNGPIWPAQ